MQFAGTCWKIARRKRGKDRRKRERGRREMSWSKKRQGIIIDGAKVGEIDRQTEAIEEGEFAKKIKVGVLIFFPFLSR